MDSIKAMRVFALSLIAPIFLSGCFYYGGDEICIQSCEMSPDKTEYIFGNMCGSPSMSVPTQYVQHCYHCSEGRGGKGDLTLALSYPDFAPVTDFSSEGHGYLSGRYTDKIFINIGQNSCNYPNYKENKKSRSQEIKELLEYKLESKKSEFSKPVRLSGNMYATKNSAKFSADEEFFYSKTPSDVYEFLVVCHSYDGCSSSSKIENTPYYYNYQFEKPSKIEDMVLIDKSVKDYVLRVYEGKLQ